MRDPFDALPSDRVNVALRRILDSDSVSARERTTSLIHRLGEQGYEQFGDLLKIFVGGTSPSIIRRYFHGAGGRSDSLRTEFMEEKGSATGSGSGSSPPPPLRM